MTVSLNKSRNSMVATHGFRAEAVFCSQEDVQTALEIYFGKAIKSRFRIHGKKGDVQIEFVNGTKVILQNKDGNGKGRGWSVDRRSVEGYEPECKPLLKTLCLKQGTERPVVGAVISKQVIHRGVMGTDEIYCPHYFTHTMLDKVTGKIVSLSICPTEKLMNCLYSELYSEMVPKRTCVHLSPNIYLQRKGGGKKDHSPDDIQMKFRFTESVEKLYTLIFPKTILQ